MTKRFSRNTVATFDVWYSFSKDGSAHARVVDWRRVAHAFLRAAGANHENQIRFPFLAAHHGLIVDAESTFSCSTTRGSEM